jgi:hypothetical protein
MPINVVIAGPFQDRTAGELRPIIADNTSWLSINTDKRIQFSGNPSARDAGIGHKTQVLTAAVVIHGQHAELARRTKRVRHKIQRSC